MGISIGSKVKVHYLDCDKSYLASVIDLTIDPNDPIYSVWVKLDVYDSFGRNDYWLSPKMIDVDSEIRIEILP